jgi:curved DNA binding protein
MENADMIKIEFSVHIDGYIASIAHSVVLNPHPESPILGRIADVYCAGYFAAEALVKVMKPGVAITALTEVIERVAANFNCKPVSNSQSFEMKRFVIEGHKGIPNKLDIDAVIDQAPSFIGENEVYAINVLISSGSGKPKSGEFKTTMFQRNVHQKHTLKLKASRNLFNEIDKKCSAVLPFSLNILDDPARARLGISECVQHKLLHPLQVEYEQYEQFVCQFKFTVLVDATGAKRLTPTFPLSFVKSEYSLDADTELLSLINNGL